MPRVIIGFAGLIGSGKSTAADYLVEHHGFTKVKFADPLKNMLRALGLGEREIEGDRKEAPCDLLCGRTPRQAMIWLGTEWGRDMIGPDLWIRAWRAAVDRLPTDAPIVVDDCRFPNEADAIRALSPVSMVVRVTRPGLATASGGHVSELQAFPVDVTIKNDGAVGDLRAAVDDLLLTDDVRFG